jgi:hypothetical protein
VGLHFRLKTLFWIAIYVAICCMVYVESNLWVGTGVVFATIVWLIASTIHAYRQHNRFSLVFSISAWSWLVFWLGFYAQTPPNSPNWRLPDIVFRVTTLFRDWPPYDQSAPTTLFGTMHSFHTSGQMGTDILPLRTPTWHNAIRLAVCATSLIVGFLAAVIDGLFLKARVRARREVAKLPTSTT